MQVYDNKILMYSKEDSFKASNFGIDAIKDSELDIKVAFHPQLNAVVPVVEGYQGDKTINLPNWIMQAGRVPDSEVVKVKIREIFTGAGVEYNEDDVNACADIPREILNNPERKYEEELTSVSVDIQTTNFIMANKYLDSMKYPYPNVNAYRESATSKLAIKLPTVNQITSHNLEEEFPSTQYHDLVDPFTGPVYSLRGILSVLAAPTRELKYRYLKECFEIAKSIGMKISDSDRERYINTFEEMPLEHVAGSEDNDLLPIQEFERPFYENLIEFINYHNENFIRTSNPSWSEDQIQEEVQEWTRQGKIYMGVSLYFYRLIKDITKRHLGFTGKFNELIDLGEFDENANEDIGRGESTGAEERDSIRQVSSGKSQYSLNDGIFSYIEQAARDYGVEAWAEGIVKLTRFKEYRPKNLVVGQGNLQVFDLVNGKVNTTSALDLTNLEIEEDVNGGTMSLIAVAYNDFPDEDGSMVSYPFTLVVTQYGTIISSGEQTSVKSTITLFDIVRSYKKGKPLLYEYTLNNGQFIHELDSPEEIAELLPAQVINMKLADYVSEELAEWSIDNRVPKMSGTSWTALHFEELDSEQFDGSKTVAEELIDVPPALKASTVQNILAGVIAKGAKDYSPSDLLDLLNWYAQEVYPAQEAEYERLFSAKEVNGANVEAVHLFTSVEGGDTLDEQDLAPQPTHNFNLMDAGEHMFIPLKNKDGSKLIAYVAPVAKRQFLFAAEGEVPASNIKDTQDVYDKVAPFILKGIVGARIGSPVESNQYFVSKETPLKIVKALFS